MEARLPVRLEDSNEFGILMYSEVRDAVQLGADGHGQMAAYFYDEDSKLPTEPWDWQMEMAAYRLSGRLDPGCEFMDALAKQWSGRPEPSFWQRLHLDHWAMERNSRFQAAHFHPALLALAALYDDGRPSGVSSRYRASAARNPRTPPALLPQLAKDRMVEVRAQLARNPNLPVELVRALAMDSEREVRVAVARHVRLPQDVALRLARDSEGYVWRALSRRVDLSEAVYMELATKNDVEALGALAGNAKVPDSVLAELTTCSDERASRIARGALERRRHQGIAL